jgi:YD repeat-containing protein
MALKFLYPTKQCQRPIPYPLQRIEKDDLRGRLTDLCDTSRKISVMVVAFLFVVTVCSIAVIPKTTLAQTVESIRPLYGCFSIPCPNPPPPQPAIRETFAYWDNWCKTTFPGYFLEKDTNPLSPARWVCSWTGCNPAQKFCNGQAAIGAWADTCPATYVYNNQSGYCERPDPSIDPDKVVGDCPPGTCLQGNPINPANGNKYQKELDYVGNGQFPLRVERAYNSGSIVSTVWGAKWRGVYDRSISHTPSAVYAVLSRPDGKQLRFRQIAATWVSDADVLGSLVRLANIRNITLGWKYTNESDEIENYDASGKLTSIVNRQGLTTTLNYDAQSRLTTVTDSFGRVLNFTYDAANRVVTTTDSNAGIYQYAYDANNILTSITYPGGAIRTYLYGEIANTSGATLPNHLTGIIDENGVHFAKYQYDAQGRVILTEHAGGVERYAFSYDATGTKVADPLNTLATGRTFEFQTLLRVQRNMSVAGIPCTSCGSPIQTYDTNGNVSGRTDWNGNRTCHAYDLTRNLETVRGEGLGNAACPANLGAWAPVANTAQRKITTQWHPTFRLPTVIAEPLRKTTYLYNGDGGASCGFKADGTTLVPGVLCSKTIQGTTDTTGAQGVNAAASGNPRVWTYTHNQNGSVLTMTAPPVQTAGGPVNPVTTYTYHANNATCPTTAPGSSAIGCRGQIASVSNALGQTTQISAYNAHGQPLTVIDPNGLVTTMSYDARMRLTSRNVGGETTTYAYDGVGQLTKVTLPDASALEYQYDAAHRLTEIRMRDSSNALIGKTTYTLDAMGNRTAEQIKDPADVVLQARTRVYNNLNRLIRDIGGTNPGSQVTNYAYDNQGNLQSVTAPAGAGGTRRYSYDALNRLATQIDPAVNANPAAGAGVTAYAYSGLDQLTAVTDPRSLITSYNYDGLNNLNQQTSPDTGTTLNTYDTAGNILTSTDARNQVTSYTYDALARVTGMTYNQATGSQLKSVTYQYDSIGNGNFGVGRLTQVSETGADNSTLQTTRYRYDQKGRLTEESRTLNGIAFVTGYGYDSTGRLTSVSYPTGRTVNYILDGVGRIAAISTTKAGATQTVLNNAVYRPFGPITGFTFGNNQTYSRNYDLDGRTTSYSQATQNVSLGYDFASRITQLGANSYGYDEIDRLTSATAATGNQAFAYDKVGNRTAKTVGPATDTYNFSATSNRLAQIIGATNKTYAYDATGSVTGDSVNTFTYDARGRMIQAVGTLGTSTYQVSSQGQRVRKSGAGGDTVFHYDAQGRLIAETTAGGATQKEYIYLGDLPVAVIQ